MGENKLDLTASSGIMVSKTTHTMSDTKHMWPQSVQCYTFLNGGMGCPLCRAGLLYYMETTP